ncbi:MAG: dynamin family protein [Gammaproteobacteria bacterium]|nr:dynamin family protein [Gammaproteobacteria bacterium]
MSTNALDIDETLQQDRFSSQMEAFAQWKTELVQTIRDYQEWLIQHDKSSSEIELRIFDALKALDSDNLNIAFVAEFSRGKTELINAIFFANYGRRLLPSEAGRTTMCPTELYYDKAKNQSFIKLLPIETRLSDASLSELKNEESYWTSLPLDINSPDQMAEAFKEVVKTKEVPMEEAEKLGLYSEEIHASDDGSPVAKHIEIPMWRHALISFPHPLLKQGLVILDTPGLNALGSEPELTLNMLPSAQAVLFILSADTGVTKSDLDMWKNHIMAFRNKKQSGLVAVLNKIDILWDEMKKPSEVLASIEEQRKTSALMLGIDTSSVYPVSAQKALLAKTKKDDQLLKKSNLLSLESLLANEILPTKQQMIWESVVEGLNQSINNTYDPVAGQLQDIKKQLKQLEALRGKNENVVQQLLQKAKEQKVAYYESVKNFQASRRRLATQAKVMFNTLGMDAIDVIIDKTRHDMSGSWTTNGMKNGMTLFFESSREAMQIAERHSDEIHKLIEGIYKKFHDEHGLKSHVAPKFNIQPHIAELDQLAIKAEEFRNSPISTMAEQSFVVKKFFISLVSHVRNTFGNANREADAWLKELINPLVIQIQEKRTSIDKYMATLSKIKESKNNLDGQLKQLNVEASQLEKQAEALENMRKTLQNCTPPG